MKKLIFPSMLFYQRYCISPVNQKPKAENKKNNPNWTGLTVLSTRTVYTELKKQSL